ncbi:PX11C protein, partial [Cardinalis cardinalis]|nr:PX11C protein [Cardinalis cardinalis]
VRALSYGCQLAGAALPGPGGLPGGLLAASAQLSSCRTALRLFDDLAMLRHSCSYGLGPEVRTAPVLPGWAPRCSSSSLELVVKEGGKNTPPVRRCRRNNSVLFRSLRILFQLRRKLSQHKCTSPQRQQELRAQVKAEVLSVLMDTADLCNAIHWLPPGFLWAGRLPPWLVGLLGTISSLIGIYQASRGANSEAA